MDDDKKKENKRFDFSNQIFEPITIIINILFILSLKNYTNPNWYINFMTIIKKLSLLLNLAIILPKIIFLFHLFEYLKNL